MDSFSAAEAARLAGFSRPLMLNYLERSGTFVSEIARHLHHGKMRRYSYRDVVVLRAINRLLELGARPKRIQESLNSFRQLSNLPHDSGSLFEFAKASAFFVVATDRVTYCSSAEELIELTHKGQMSFSFMIGTRDAFAPVAATIFAYSKAVAGGQPRNLATLNRHAKNNGLTASGVR